jgi:maltose O-acetyltransferase
MIIPKTSFLHRLRLLTVKINQRLRVLKYLILSDIFCCDSMGNFNQPVLMTGHGKVQLGRCNLGVWPSPYYLNGYIHIEARNATASIKIEDGVWINNNAVIICERSCISIGANTLIGTEFKVYDSDFHDLQPSHRMAGTHQCASVSIGKNVFIGCRVMVMKGVVIGDNSVIASGAVVTHSLPANCIAGGVPAKVIRYLRTNGKQEGYLLDC